MVRTANGQFGPGNQAAVRKAARPPGAIGVVAYAGYVSTGERNPKLLGNQKWVTYSNAENKPIIATGLRYFANLLAGTNWHAEPNEAGGRGARKGAEIVRQGLLESPMLRPWPQVVRKAAMYRPLGFSLHASAMRRRKDGMVVYSAIEHRQQSTIERWLRKDEFSPWTAVIQRARESQREITIPLDECFYCVDDTLTDSPEGVGLLRHVIEYVRRLDLFEEWEGDAYSGDLTGVPYTKAPLGEMATLAGTEDPTEIRSRIDENTQVVRDFMVKRNKKPEEKQYLMQDSAYYANPDGTLTGNPKWSFEVMKTETANLTAIDVTIRRVELQIARVLGVEWALMGADGKGSYAQHEDKTSMFATNLQTTLTELGWFATMQLARRLIVANGLDPDTCTPKLIAEPVSTDAVETVTRALANLSLAGAPLPPNYDGFNVILDRMRLPGLPDNAGELMAPRLPVPGAEVTEEDADTDTGEDQDAETTEADV